MVAAGSESLRALHERLPRGLGDFAYHSLENPLMERKEDIPVKNPEKASWQES
jgi:hypothetical protein